MIYLDFGMELNIIKMNSFTFNYRLIDNYSEFIKFYCGMDNLREFFTVLSRKDVVCLFKYIPSGCKFLLSVYSSRIHFFVECSNP